MASKEIIVPDLGNAKNVDVIEVLVAVGDKIKKDDSLITLETDKATMEVPASDAGIVEKIQVAVGNKVSAGDIILTLKVEGEEKAAPVKEVKKESPVAAAAKAPAEKSVPAAIKEIPAQSKVEPMSAEEDVHAGPGVRRIAHEFGIDLHQIRGTGAKGRVLKEDVQAYVKQRLASPAGVGLAMPLAAPVIDFSKYGTTESKPLNKIKRLTGQHVHRSWITVPHVTQFDEADITEMEAFRKSSQDQAEKLGVKLTPLVFVMKAVVAGLRKYPHFNSSLDASGENIILKKYFHIGVAVDTPNGLVVPVVRDVDQKGFMQLAKELADISSKAREKGLSPSDMEGSCFTISSLGGIGGTAFTPIVNVPDVAILGLSRAKMQPVYQHGEFVPRLMMPLSLSYDHRVIDGAEGARFTQFIAECLSDIRKLLL